MTKTTSGVNGKLWGSHAHDWAVLQEVQCRPVYQRVFERLGVGAGTSYLDAGCGAGLALQMAAERGAEVHGLDAAEALLAIARERLPNADLRQGELQELPFDAAAFDVVSGFNSFQYAADPLVALAEAARVVKTTGTVVVMTWNRPEGMAAASLVAALKPLLPPLPEGTKPRPGPFSLSEESALRGFAVSAGLTPADVFDVDSPWQYADLPSALRGLGSSGVAQLARDYSGSEAVDQAHAAALAPFRQTNGAYRIEASFRCLFAKPV